MRLLSAVIIGVGAAGAGQGDTLALPSGAQAAPLPVVWDEDMSVLRLRYVVPHLSEGDDSYAEGEDVLDDMLWLCDTQAFELLGTDTPPQDQGWTGAVITLMDREVEFGVVDQQALQLFEWFSFADGKCEIDLDDWDD
jgi:hypothetical protein